MTEVSSVTELLATTIPPRPLTVDDLERLPDDAWRYELVDGSLIVSPPPTVPHQIAVTRLLGLLLAAADERLVPLAGGAGILLADETYLVPDLLVVRADGDLTGRGVRPSDVVLVVEVVSPSNAVRDLVLKRALYARHGIPGYWIVDTRTAPAVTVLALDGSGGYEVVQEIGPEQTGTVDEPLAVRITPRDLLP